MTRRSKATSTADRRRPARYRIVGGKGGVGKTTCAAALALDAAASGTRTLLLSTDPAPSLGDALRIPLRSRPTRVPGAPGLYAAQVHAVRVLDRWLSPRFRTLEQIGIRATWLDREDVDRLLRLSLPGVDEIAGLLDMLEHGRSGRFDLVVVDTAPTGHTLRMLSMPRTLEGVGSVFDAMQARYRAMVEALRGRWEPDAADALILDLEHDARELARMLTDASRLTASWVTLPEPMAIAETLDGLAGLRGHGVTVDTIVVNRRVPEPDPSCDWCVARDAFERGALRLLAPAIRRMRGVRTTVVTERATEPRGVRALAAVGRDLRSTPREAATRPRPASAVRTWRPPSAGHRGVEPFDASRVRLALFGGKGGVGKTTCAAAAALEAARAHPARRVLLLSTDPAHSLADVLQIRVGDVPRRLRGAPANLHVRELDAQAAFAAMKTQYADAIDALFDRLMGGSSMDAVFDRRIMHALIDLAPPGLDELVAVLEVTEALTSSSTGASCDLVVMDTAPSGHALRLLETPAVVHEWVKTLMAILLKYQALGAIGNVGAVLVRLSRGLRRLRALLVDADATRFIPVVRPAALPREETIRLIHHLRGARISAPVVVVNALGRGSCAVCRRASAAQQRELRTLAAQLRRATETDRGIVVAPAWMPAPTGCRDLTHWRRTWRTTAPEPAGKRAVR